MRRLSALAPMMIAFLLGPEECRAQSASVESSGPVILPANTPVILRLKESLYKKDAKPGHPVEFEAGSDVVVNGQVVIERGAAINASVRQVDHTGKGPAKVLIDLGPAQTVSGEMVRLAPTRTPKTGDSFDPTFAFEFPPIIPVFLVMRVFEKRVFLDKEAGRTWLGCWGCGVWVVAHVAENVALDAEKLKTGQGKLHERSPETDMFMGFYGPYLSYVELMGAPGPLPESSSKAQVDTNISRPLLSLLSTARRLETAGDLDGAIKEYEQALDLRLDSPELRAFLLALLATALEEKGDFAHAIEEARQALALKPDVPGLHVLLAKLFQKKGDFVHAIEEAQQALALKPNFPGLLDEHSREGFITFLVESGDADAALAEIKETMRIWPDNIYFHYLLGRALVRKNDPDSAIVELQWVLKQEKNQDWKASCALGSAYELKGDLKAALRQYRTAIRAHGGDKECHAAYERLQLRGKK